jgi:hypothetical protein
MYGQAPGSTKVIDLGVKGEAGTGTPEAVGIGGQQYFQQPGEDGQFERIPQEKAAPAPPSIEEHGGIKFINQNGQLVPIDNVMKKMKENFVVTGDFEGAAAVHQWETRPSNQEYFDRMLQYVNAPADQLLISAIARGQGLVAPPPEETIQRIGPPPEYLTEAFNMLRDQMQMGQPGEGQTAQDVMLDRAAKLDIEAKEIANKAAESQIKSLQVKDKDQHDAAVMAREKDQLNNETVRLNNEKMFMESAPGLQDVFPTATTERSVAPTPYGAFDTGDDDFLDTLGAASIGSLPLAQRPQMSEYNDVATDFANTGFQFGDVAGVPRDEIKAYLDDLEKTNPRAFFLAEQVFRDQGGMYNAGAFLNSIDGLEKILNHHLGARGWELVGDGVVADDDDDDGDGSPIETADGVTLSSDTASAITKVVEAPVAGVETGETDVDEAQRAGTTGEGMSRDEIFRKYPFLAPEGWGRYDAGDTGGDDFVEAPAAPAAADAGQYGGLPTGIPLYGMDTPTGTERRGPGGGGRTDYPELPIFGGTVGTANVPYIPPKGRFGSPELPYASVGAANILDTSPWADYPETPQAPFPYAPTALEAAAATPYDYAAEGGMGDIDPTFERDLALRQTEVKAAPVVRGPDVAPVQAPVAGVGQYGGLPAAAGSGLDVQGSYGVDARYPKTLDIDPSEPSYYDYPVKIGAGSLIVPDVAEQMYAPFEFEESAPFAPTSAPVVTPAGVGAPVPEDPKTMAGRWYDEGAYGVRTGSKPTLVGESGPELALFPNGTEIVPLDRRMKPSQARRLRRRGIRGMQEGGIVFGPDQYRARGGDAGVRALPGYKGTDKFITSETLSGLQSGALRQDPKDLSRIYDPNAPVPTPKLPRETASSVYDSPLPLGIRQLQAGRSLGAPRGQLLRTAGIALPSAQARRRMLPSEREAFQGLGRMAGIPAEEFQQELGITTPSGSPRTGSARMLPLSLRR